MRRSNALWLLLLPLACGTGDELFGDGKGPAKASSSNKGAAQATSTTGSSSGDTGAGGAGGVSGSGGATTSSDAASSTADTSSSTGGGDPCAIEPNDGDCPKCVKTNCCVELTNCMADTNCACWVQCEQLHDYIFCQNMCGSQGTVHGFLNACVNSQCLFICL